MSPALYRAMDFERDLVEVSIGSFEGDDVGGGTAASREDSIHVEPTFPIPEESRVSVYCGIKEI